MFINRKVIKNHLGIIPVIARGANGNTCETYALVDDGTDKTLCDERSIQMLGTESRPVTFQMTTATSQKVRHEGREVDIQVQSMKGDNIVDLNRVWSVKSLPISTQSAVKSSDLDKFPYLSDIRIPEINNNDVLLLIGTGVPAAHIPI